MSPPSVSDDHLPLRSRAAIMAGRAVAGASKAANLGSGSVIGGRLSLALDGDLLATLTAGREVALISATNGKTTTTHLLATALSRHGPVVANTLGANMPPGIVAALGDADPAARAVLEVDERWMPTVLRAVGPATVVLLNLSRDQLDRSHEVRKIADSWRSMLEATPAKHLIANADDPLIVWAASGAPESTDLIWVGCEAHWTNDASGCPSCGGRIEFEDEPTPTWGCTQCAFAKPETSWRLITDEAGRFVVERDGEATIVLDLALPGRVNAANAAHALAAATAMGCDPARAAQAINTVADVAGRYRTERVGPVDVRMLLAKNPAGWQEAIEMLGSNPRPLIASINARIADGRDPSWLWDVPFERLAGRFVVTLGERRHDLAVRLHYAEIEHVVATSLLEAAELAAARAPGTDVDLIANYTAFQDYLDELDARGPADTITSGSSDEVEVIDRPAPSRTTPDGTTT